MEEEEEKNEDEEEEGSKLNLLHFYRRIKCYLYENINKLYSNS